MNYGGGGGGGGGNLLLLATIAALALLAAWAVLGTAAAQPTGIVTQIDAGDDHTCVVTEAWTAICWGRNDAGQSDAAESTLTFRFVFSLSHLLGQSFIAPLCQRTPLACPSSDGNAPLAWRAKLAWLNLMLDTGEEVDCLLQGVCIDILAKWWQVWHCSARPFIIQCGKEEVHVAFLQV